MKKEESSVNEQTLVDDLEESLKKDLTISNSFMFAKVPMALNSHIGFASCSLSAPVS